MAEQRGVAFEGLTYVVPGEVRPRKVIPPLLVVINESCTACAGSPSCAELCPADCIHLVLEHGRPVRVWVDNAACIGCMNCLSYQYRPRDVVRGETRANCNAFNARNPFQKAAVCAWDAIEILPLAAAAERSALFYPQARTLTGGQEITSQPPLHPSPPRRGDPAGPTTDP